MRNSKVSMSEQQNRSCTTYTDTCYGCNDPLATILAFTVTELESTAFNCKLFHTWQSPRNISPLFCPKEQCISAKEEWEIRVEWQLRRLTHRCWSLSAVRPMSGKRGDGYGKRRDDPTIGHLLFWSSAHLPIIFPSFLHPSSLKLSSSQALKAEIALSRHFQTTCAIRRLYTVPTRLRQCWYNKRIANWTNAVLLPCVWYFGFSFWNILMHSLIQ